MSLIKKMAVTVLLLAAAVTAHAYDFAATVPSGQTLYFSIVEGGVEVVRPANTVQPTLGWNGFQKPTGALTIPSAIVHDGVSYSIVAVGNYALYGCTGLTHVDIQQGVHAVGSQAFAACTGLVSASLPASVDSLSGTFVNCTALTSLTMHSDQPPYCNNSAFMGVSVADATLTVPCGASANYAAVAPWSSFGNISEDSCGVTLTVSANYASRGSVSGSGTYPGGTVVVMTATPAEGFFFACWNDGDTINPRTLQLQHESSYTACFFALLYDTVYAEIQHDTVEIHDTVHMVVMHVDTVTATDTVVDTVSLVVTHTDTVEVHDTAWLSVTLFDTVEVHDTAWLSVTLFDTVEVHDTLTLYVEGVDTLWMHDTTVVRDTLLPTFFRLTVDGGTGGIGIGNAILPAGTEAEFGVLPLEGYRFVRWDDGYTDNPRRATLTSNAVYTAVMEQLDIEETTESTWSMRLDGRLLTVDCEPGHTLNIYSADGRLLLARATAARNHVRLASAGVYLVQVDDGAARRIVVGR